MSSKQITSRSLGKKKGVKEGFKRINFPKWTVCIRNGYTDVIYYQGLDMQYKLLKFFSYFANYKLQVHINHLEAAVFIPALQNRLCIYVNMHFHYKFLFL